MAFDYRARLLPFTFTAPSGATFKLKYDKLDREGGKKSSVNEILDSNSSEIQDQGNRAERFPVDVYFTGEDYDLLADGFFSALSEKYRMTRAGTLIHPRWGPLTVFPLKWQQSESFVAGQRRANFNIEFVKVYRYDGIFKTIGLAISQVVGLVELLGSGDLQSFIKNIPIAVSAIGSKLTSSLEIVKNSVTDLIHTHISVRDIVNNIHLESKDLLSDPGGNADLLIGQIQKIIKTPMEFTDDSFAKINKYTDIISNLIIENSNVGDVSDPVRKNKAIILERLAGYAVAVQCAASLSTEFKTRSSAISAIEILKSNYDSFLNAMEISRVESDLENSFSGDYEFLDSLYDIYTKSSAILLKNSFDLSSEVRLILSEQSDPVTLCYKYYQKVDNETLDFFFQSNSIKNSEFLELNAGREVVFYVN